MNASLPFLVMMMMLGGAPGNDMLSLVPSDVYWKAKDVDLTTTAIMIDLNSLKPDDTSKAVAVRRLMAIRTLGELKNADAVSMLKPLLDSKEMFVAEYAQRALDAIDGKTAPPVSGVPPDRMKTDLYMLPEHCGGVVQVRLFPGKLGDAKKSAPATQPENAAGGDQAQAQPQPNVMDQMASGFISAAEMVGNVRIDGITFGVSDEIGQQAGFVVVYIRGQWNADAVKAAMQGEFPQKKTVNDLDFLSPQFGGAVMCIPSDNFCAFSSGANPNLIPVDDMAAAIKDNKGKFENSTDLVRAVESVDMTQPLWAAMIVSDSYRQAPMLAAFDSLTMTGKISDDAVKIQATGTGKDADAVKTAVDQFNGLITEGKTELTHEAETQPAAQAMLDFLNTIELKSDGTTATGSGTMKRGLLPMAVGEAHAVP